VTALELYKGVRVLLDDPARWIHHGPVAVRADGEPAGEPTEPEGWMDDDGDALASDATAWCLVGACQKVAGYSIRFDDPLLQPLRDAIPASPSYYIPGFGLSLGLWNDAEDRTHAEVIAALDRAIVAVSK